LNTRDLWNRYARYFNAEEGFIFPADQPELDFYRRIRENHTGLCLEIGAGAGRLAGSLHAESVTVALEPSDSMLQAWSQFDSKLAVRLQGTGELLPFRSSCFDLVCFPYNGLQCVSGSEVRAAVVKEAFRVTAPGGVFVLEVSPVFARRGSEPLTQRYNAAMPDGTRLILREKVESRPDIKSVRYHMYYTTVKTDGSEVTDDVTLDLAATSRDETVALLKQTGFCDIIQWGNYDRSPYHNDLSPRLLVSAGKEE
jgi:ubiquinone/menaquinone biosynthesis C-methylase UbiE